MTMMRCANRSVALLVLVAICGQCIGEGNLSHRRRLPTGTVPVSIGNLLHTCSHTYSSIRKGFQNRLGARTRGGSKIISITAPQPCRNPFRAGAWARFKYKGRAKKFNLDPNDNHKGWQIKSVQDNKVTLQTRIGEIPDVPVKFLLALHHDVHVPVHLPRASAPTTASAPVVKTESKPNNRQIADSNQLESLSSNREWEAAEKPVKPVKTPDAEKTRQDSIPSAQDSIPSADKPSFEDTDDSSQAITQQASGSIPDAVKRNASFDDMAEEFPDISNHRPTITQAQKHTKAKFPNHLPTTHQLRVSSDVAGECAICLEKFVQNTVVMRMPQCGQYIHMDCYKNYSKNFSKEECPLCKGALVLIKEIAWFDQLSNLQKKHERVKNLSDYKEFLRQKPKQLHEEKNKEQRTNLSDLHVPKKRRRRLIDRLNEASIRGRRVIKRARKLPSRRY